MTTTNRSDVRQKITLQQDGRRTYTEHCIQRGRHTLRAREYPGEGPAVVMLHGFPDNLHLYDRVVPHLDGRRTVVFDFLGWGGSDKPADHRYTFDGLTADLDAVITQLRLEQVVLVAHDASGPPVVDWALAHPERIAALVLLNTFYGPSPTLRSPEAIALFSSPRTRRVARAVSARFDLFRRLYYWQVGRRFIRDRDVAEEFVPLLFSQFQDQPSTKPAFFALNEDYLPTIAARGTRTPELRQFRRPVHIVFGAQDYTLDAGIARHFHDLFPSSQLHLLSTARHFPQLDEPQEVARLIRAAD